MGSIAWNKQFQNFLLATEGVSKFFFFSVNNWRHKTVHTLSQELYCQHCIAAIAQGV